MFCKIRLVASSRSEAAQAQPLNDWKYTHVPPDGIVKWYLSTAPGNSIRPAPDGLSAEMTWPSVMSKFCASGTCDMVNEYTPTRARWAIEVTISR